MNPGRLLLAMLAAAGFATALARADEPVRLKPSRPVARGIAAFPRVTGKTGDAAPTRINRALAQADRFPGCTGHKGGWERWITVTMRGPRYLSLLASDNWDCGGPHPDTNLTALVFDLATGSPIDWKKLLPPELVEQTRPDPDQPKTGAVAVTSATLWKLYEKGASAEQSDKECAEVRADPSWGTDLTLWPDAEADGLVLMQTSFPHVVKACGPPITITAPELRQLGIDTAFIEALDEAHRRGWYDKTPK